MKFKHFILTRFNLPLFGTDRNGANINNLDISYLRQRIDLFTHFCTPSVAAQTCQNFEWLLLFDVSTPQVILDEINAVCSKHVNWHVSLFRVSDYENMSAESLEKQLGLPENFEVDTGPEEERLMNLRQKRFIVDVIAERIKDSGVDYILTTRLDNDDALSVDYIAQTQYIALQQQRRCLIDFVNGCQYIKHKNVLLTTSIRCNHFTTLVQPLNFGIQTPLWWNHLFVSDYVDVLHVKVKNMWLEVVHETNILNGKLASHKESFVFWGGNTYYEKFGILKEDFSVSFCKSLRLRFSLRRNIQCVYSWLYSISFLRRLRNLFRRA